MSVELQHSEGIWSTRFLGKSGRMTHKVYHAPLLCGVLRQSMIILAARGGSK